MSSEQMKTTLEIVYENIKERIINLDLKAGQKLPARSLAENLEVSRTPVREALGRLEQEGLVQRDGGWGYVVRGILFKEIFELFKIRESLEVLAAMEALHFMNKERLKTLKTILNRSAKALKDENEADFRWLSRQYHMTLASYSYNDLLINILDSLNDRVRLVGAMQVDFDTERAQEMLADNRAIQEALESGDPVPVRNAVLDHINNARRSLLKSARISPSML